MARLPRVDRPERRILVATPMQPEGRPGLEIRTVRLLVSRLDADHHGFSGVPAADGVRQRGFVDHFLGDPECLFARLRWLRAPNWFPLIGRQSCRSRSWCPPMLPAAV